MITRSPKQNMIYRTNRKNILYLNKVDVGNVLTIIIDTLNKKEEIYKFPNKEKIEKLIYEKKNFNIFSIYEDPIYNLFKDIVMSIKDACKKFELNYSKNKYFISAELIESIDTSYWYDTGGTHKPSLFGIISLNNDFEIYINNDRIVMSSGDLVISEAGNSIRYAENNKFIIFYVAPMSTIKKQYPGKWIPIL